MIGPFSGILSLGLRRWSLKPTVCRCVSFWGTSIFGFHVKLPGSSLASSSDLDFPCDFRASFAFFFCPSPPPKKYQRTCRQDSAYFRLPSSFGVLVGSLAAASSRMRRAAATPKRCAGSSLFNAATLAGWGVDDSMEWPCIARGVFSPATRTSFLG